MRSGQHHLQQKQSLQLRQVVRAIIHGGHRAARSSQLARMNFTPWWTFIEQRKRKRRRASNGQRRQLSRHRERLSVGPAAAEQLSVVSWRQQRQEQQQQQEPRRQPTYTAASFSRCCVRSACQSTEEKAERTSYL